MGTSTPPIGGAASFFAAPSAEESEGQVTFLGAPFDRTPADGTGSREGPSALRAFSMGFPSVLDAEGCPRGWYDFGRQRLVMGGVSLVDGGDLKLPHDLPVDEVDARIQQRVASTVKQGSFPVLIGGEHAVTRPALRALAEHWGQPLCLVLFDAHPDRGVSHFGATYSRDAFVDGILEDGSANLVIEPGVRDLAHPDHAKPVEGVQAISPLELRAIGATGLLERVPRDRPLYVSFDIDALDPSLAPGTTTPLPGGLGLWEALELLEALSGHPQVVGFDLTEYDPSLDPNGSTAEAAIRILLTFLDGVLGKGP